VVFLCCLLSLVCYAFEFGSVCSFGSFDFDSLGLFGLLGLLGSFGSFGSFESFGSFGSFD